MRLGFSDSYVGSRQTFHIESTFRVCRFLFTGIAALSIIIVSSNTQRGQAYKNINAGWNLLPFSFTSDSMMSVLKSDKIQIVGFASASGELTYDLSEIVPGKGDLPWAEATTTAIIEVGKGYWIKVSDDTRQRISKAGLTVNRPFPQHITYQAGTIKPTSATQTQMDTSVKDLYDAWINRYLKTAGSGKYYVYYNYENPTAEEVSCSEGHGYGMLITVLMAGYDDNAKKYFDGLYQFYKAHPSVNNSYLMAWQQVKGLIDNPDGGSDSATDGDMDIAYALLLADKQWGSDGSIDYLQSAKNIINAILSDDVNSDRWTIKLGDWSEASNQMDNDTRTSDFMPNHLKAFRTATGDTRWNSVLDKTYIIIDGLYTDYSPDTGLLPDFAVYTVDSYRPADASYLEGENDGNYYYNACRAPWRIATDYLLSGDRRAIDQLTRLNVWIRSETSGTPAAINAGYALNGAKLAEDYCACFVAPLGVAAMISDENQDWLNAIWTSLATESINDNDYFGNSVKLLSMLVMSGNWWSPM